MYARIDSDEAAGRADILKFAADPATLRGLPLASFSAGGASGVIARRLALAANVPSHWLPAKGAWPGTYAYWRGVHQALAREATDGEQTWQQLVHGPIVLLYHALGGPGEPASRYVLPARRFAQQMAWLRARRYVVLGLDELLSGLRANRLASARSVVVTFDDAYLDTFTLAFPILRRLGLPATVFAVSGRVGRTNDWEPVGPLARRPLMSWSQLAEMRQAGMRIGAHSRSHASLPSISDHALQSEIAGSRADLERELVSPIETFAYPFGHSDARVQAVVQQAGFAGACGVQPGVSDPGVSTLALPRIEMQGTWRLSHLALALHLGHVPRALAR